MCRWVFPDVSKEMRIFYLEYLTSEDEGTTSLRNVGTRPKKRHTPEDTNSQKHHCWNLKRTIVQIGSGGHPACQFSGPPLCTGATLVLQLADEELRRIYAACLRYELEEPTHTLL